MSDSTTLHQLARRQATDENGQRLITGYIPSLELAIIGAVAFGFLALCAWTRESTQSCSFGCASTDLFVGLVRVYTHKATALHAHPMHRLVHDVGKPTHSVAASQMAHTKVQLGYILRIPFRSSPGSVGLYSVTTLFVLLSVRSRIRRKPVCS